MEPAPSRQANTAMGLNPGMASTLARSAPLPAVDPVANPRTPVAAPAVPGATTGIRAVLFDANGQDRVARSLSELRAASLADSQLLWVDIGDPALFAEVARLLSLPPSAVAAVEGTHTNPVLCHGDDAFWLRVVAVTQHDAARFSGSTLTLVSRRNLVVTVHASPIPFIDALLAREAADAATGRLAADSFIAALLDWHLSTYFAAVADFELLVDRLEDSILSGRRVDCLQDLRQLRKGASRLRRMLSPHRVVFAGLARPDFHPDGDDAASAHFLALDTRFERAMDMVENGRDLVIGSFELFSSQTALLTNDAMRVLTFVTVVLGLIAVLAGVLGMNFAAPFFDSAGVGFWSAVSVMVAFAVGAVLVGRRKDWL